MVQKTAAPVAQVVHQAQQHHQAGRLRQAETLYRQVLKAAPHNVQALTGLALVAAQTGHLPPARELLLKALKVAPEDPTCLVNLGKIEISLGNVQAAHEALSQAVSFARRDAVAWNMLGWTQRRLGLAEEAEQSFRTAVRLDPRYGEALSNLGTALMLRGDADEEALKTLRKCARMAPGVYQPFMNMAILFARRGETDEAVAHGRKAVDLAPQAADAHFNLGKILHDAGRLEEAEAAYAEAVRLAPENPAFHNNLALVSEPLLKIDQAVAEAEQAVALFKGRIGELHVNYLRTLVTQGRLEEAQERVRAFLEQEPGNPEMRLYEADIAARQGRFEDAQALYQALLDEDAGNARALRGIARTTKLKPDHPAFAQMEAAAENAATPLEERVDVYFAIGKAYDDIGDSDRAFLYYNRGNAAKASQSRYDAARMEEYVAASIETFTPAFFAERAALGSTSDRPVLIVGMPRSGTTLVEQTLASHPQVAGGDELRDLNLIEQMIERRVGYPRGIETMGGAQVAEFVDLYLAHLDRIDADALRVTDKLPGNALRLGLAALLFPQARVIHCKRDPVDTCISIYFQNFSGRHDYAYDLAALGHFYRQYERLMAHWQQVCPLPILDVVYEDVVADHEAEARRMIGHLGLEWHPDMARFHKTKRSVSTASLWQVRQPIYTGSVQRWRKYEAHIGPLLEALGVEAAQG